MASVFLFKALHNSALKAKHSKLECQIIKTYQHGLGELPKVFHSAA
jgi:hypothetical protein